MAGEIPAQTHDRTVGKHFSREFSEGEVAVVKKRLKGRLGAAKGIDGIGNGDILSMPNDMLCELVQACVALRAVPHVWLTTVLIGILKKGKPANDPAGYRLIGLEVSLVKFLTGLLELRLEEWTNAENIIPRSQNGFRRGRRTSNNPFILRCAIERARALGLNLYVVFVDLTNAFPSTDIPTLWLKLWRAGCSGPIFDLLRMLYARMEYVVRHDGQYSERFQSTVGVLTGDTASPALWNIYFADIEFPEDPDDIVLDGVPVPFLAHADDGLLLSTTTRGSQHHINTFRGWTGPSFATISVTKTCAMLFNTLPAQMPRLLIGDAPIRWVEDEKLIGITFCSTDTQMFSKHYKSKASKARQVSRSIFAAERHVSRWSPPQGLKLYSARVDPHLTFGCDVVLDVGADDLKALEEIEHAYLRRLLRLSARSVLAGLYTETGLTPIRYRRILLALGYAAYLLESAKDDPDNIPLHAYNDAIALAQSGHTSWAGDVRTVLASLPVAVHMDWSDLDSVEGVELLSDRVSKSCETWLRAQVYDLQKLSLLRGRREEIQAGRKTEVMLFRRAYLRLVNAESRVAFTRLLLSDHDLAVERLRRGAGPWRKVNREWRLCRFCLRAVEDEAHALLVCAGNPSLVQLRASCLRDLFSLWPELIDEKDRPASEFMLLMIQCPNLRVRWSVLSRTARFVRDVLEVYASKDIWIPPLHLAAFGAGELRR